jgi:hypothetical protein
MLLLCEQRWEAGVAPILTDVFGEAVGLGDPVAAAQAHWMQLTATLQPAQTHTTGEQTLCREVW